MKKITFFWVNIFLFCSIHLFAQDIEFTFENAQNTNDGSNDFYEVDVMVSTINSTGTFKLGSGQLYFNYNTSAFGTNVNLNNAIEVTYPNAGGYICGQGIDFSSAIAIYSSFTINDNTSSRVSWAFSQNFAASTFAADNITDTPKKLCHLKLKYIDVNLDPMVCFESSPVFIDQFFTACGPYSGSGFETADCTAFPPTQLIEDFYDCSNYSPTINCGDVVTTWDGISWSNGIPITTSAVVFTGDYTSGSDLEACSIVVQNNSNITVSSGNTFIITGGLDVQMGSSFTIENEAALRQIDADVNTGNIIVNRNSAAMIRLDYTAWSSPVLNQQLLAFSPNTETNRFYEYLYTGTTTPTAYQSVDSSTDFINGKGYMIRVDNTWPTSTPQVYNGQFTGNPVNGPISTSIGIGYNLVGNPYPSPLDADLFLNDNSSVGTLYFWTHTAPASGGSYPINNYASYTTLGGTASAAGGQTPNGFIQTGQGFYVNTSSSGTANFSNTQRVNASSSTQFFRSSNASSIEKHRLWLNLDDATLNYNQILVGYMSGATNDFDNLIDGKSFDVSNTMLYNIIDADKYVIQGRQLPFDLDDIVPLGLQVINAGTYTISLDSFDGNFLSQDIFLKDNYTSTIHDLKTGAYSFNSAVGSFEDRFEVVYKNSVLSNDDHTINNNFTHWLNDSEINLSSSLVLIEKVYVFDLTGRLLTAVEDIDSLRFSLPNTYSTDILLLKVVLANDLINNIKIITKH